MANIIQDGSYILAADRLRALLCPQSSYWYLGSP
jgi:hypothetical protein